MMSNAKAKTINLLLYEGTLKGVISMADSSWNSGELYSALRESVDDLISSDACSKFGVYLLLSEDMVYVGQSSDLSKRIKQHIIGKDWWERVVVLTTSDDSLNRSDIDYLESILISRAGQSNRLDCENKNRGNIPKVDRFRKVVLEQYLDEALFLMELIGISVFGEVPKKAKKKTAAALIKSVTVNTKSEIEIRAKRVAKQFLEENGVMLPKSFNYAKRLDLRAEFWVNPRIEVINQDWTLVLNNQFKNELIVIKIPAGTFKMQSENDAGLSARKDKPEYIDLKILEERLVDKRSKCDFGKFVEAIFKY